IGAIVYCHVVPDERTSESTAGRLQWELGLKAANPFAISQAHHGALLVGLDIAASLVEGPEQARAVLLVASDKLLQESPARAARGVLSGAPGAGGPVGRHHARGWRWGGGRPRPFALDAASPRAWGEPAAMRFVEAGASAIGELLRTHGIEPIRL